jgi:4-aminobutyrate aminotransferase
MNGPALKTALPGPRAKALIERDAKVVSTSYTRDYPLVIARGEGALVEDVDGNVFLDCTAGIAVTSTGHSHPDVVAAIVEQSQKFLHMSGTDFYYEPQVRLGEELSALAPMPGPHRSFFGNSGTEANEAAIKLARYYTKRSNIIAFFGAFHGRSMGSLALTASKLTQRRGFGPFVPGVYHAPYANCYRCPVGLSPDNCAAECLRFIEEQLFVHLVAPDEVAAIVVEPIQGEGGYVVPPNLFHERLREITRKFGMLLIVDEVQSGMGRTGKMFAIEHTGVMPDVVTDGEGDCVGAAAGCDDVAIGDRVVATGHAREHVRWQSRVVRRLARHAQAASGGPREECRGRWRAHDRGVKTLMDKHSIIGDVRGRGLMIGVELVRDRQTKERATTERDRVVHECFKRGLLVLGAGQNSIRLSPPLVLTKEQADTAIKILDEAIGAIGA